MPIPFTNVKRSASAPKRCTTSSGSIPLPSDLDMRRPVWSRTVPVRYTSRKGTSPRNSKPDMIIRATQKKMISGAVTSVWPG